MKGYRQMIRDRMPKMLDLALTWCKAKQKWIDLVYENVVKKYPQNKRGTIVKMILGIKQQYTRQEIYDYFRYVMLMDVTKEQMLNIPKDDLFYKFKDSIQCTHGTDSYEYWLRINEWVEWFRIMHIKVQSSYEHSLSFGNDKRTTKSLIMSKFGLDSKLADYLIKSF